MEGCVLCVVWGVGMIFEWLGNRFFVGVNVVLVQVEWLSNW